MIDHLSDMLSADGARRVCFYAHGDGLYSWTEEALMHSEQGDYGHPDSWWSPVLNSGRYDTLANAQADAAAELPWLRNSSPVTPPPAQP